MLTVAAGAASDEAGGNGGARAGAKQCVFGPLYASCIRANRKHRYAFLRGLLSLFEAKASAGTSAVAGGGRSHAPPPGGRRVSFTPAGGLGSAAAGAAAASAPTTRDPAFLAFVARVLAALPFDVQEEPLFLIYHISRLVSLDGSALLSELRALFARAGWRTGDGVGEGDGEAGADDQGAAGQGGGRDSDSEDSVGPQAAGATGAEGDEEGMEVNGGGGGHGQGQARLTPALLAELKAKCALGMAFGALLHLKFYLKQVSNNNDGHQFWILPAAACPPLFCGLCVLTHRAGRSVGQQFAPTHLHTCTTNKQTTWQWQV